MLTLSRLLLVAQLEDNRSISPNLATIALLIDHDWDFDNEFDVYGSPGEYVPPSSYRSDKDVVPINGLLARPVFGPGALFRATLF